MELPASLKAIKPYLELAKKMPQDKAIGYYCRLYALQEAMALRAKIPKADMAFIMSLMDQVEAEKSSVPDVDSPSMHVENTASDLFQKADDADRAGNHGLQVAKDFLAAANLFDVCKQFAEGGVLPEDLAEKSKYGKWRFVELCKAAKERRAPAPPRGMDEDAMPSVGQDITAIGPPPTEPPPSYLDLPPGGAPEVGGATSQTSFEAPQVPQVMPPSAAGGTAASPPPPYTAVPAIVVPGFTPSRAAMMDAARLCKSAESNLQFQDHLTALSTLQQAIAVLTTPPPAAQ